MAAAVLTFSSPIKSTHRSTNLYRARTALSLPRISLSSLSQCGPLDARQVYLSRCSRSGRCNGPRLVSPYRHMQAFLPPTALEEPNLSGVEVGKENELQIEVDESREAWKLTLESFKEEARKMKDRSQEAYDLYSKRALVIFKRTSKALKTQADKARHDLSLVAKQINEEGQAYLLTAADSSPEPVKDIAETLFSSSDELKEVSAIRDFYVGIPYGALLAIGGFLNFMLTGSIPAIRFGLILGSILLAFSISSLRSWKSGQPSRLSLIGQAAITTIVLIREGRLLTKMRSLSNLLLTLSSGAMLAFYVYRMIVEERTSLGQSSEK